MLCIPQAHWLPKILKAKRDRKDIKLLAAKKTTYVEVNTHFNQIQKIFLTFVYQRVTSDPKEIKNRKY